MKEQKKEVDYIKIICAIFIIVEVFIAGFLVYNNYKVNKIIDRLNFYEKSNI